MLRRLKSSHLALELHLMAFPHHTGLPFFTFKVGWDDSFKKGGGRCMDWALLPILPMKRVDKVSLGPGWPVKVRFGDLNHTFGNLNHTYFIVLYKLKEDDQLRPPLTEIDSLHWKLAFQGPKNSFSSPIQCGVLLARLIGLLVSSCFPITLYITE